MTMETKETKETKTDPKALKVTPETHRVIKAEAAKQGLTIDEMVMQMFIIYVGALKREQEHADKLKEIDL